MVRGRLGSVVDEQIVNLSECAQVWELKVDRTVVGADLDGNTVMLGPTHPSTTAAEDFFVALD